MNGSESLVQSVDFELIGAGLGKDVKAALKIALAGGAVFSTGADPLTIFRKTLAGSIRNIEQHPRGKLFQAFLLKGPYENSGEIPVEMVKQRLSDDECAAAINFIYSFMVNSFKGAVTELLATKACMKLIKHLKETSQLPVDVRLYVGDAVRVYRPTGKGFLKGADMYILTQNGGTRRSPAITVAGVVEVKSYKKSRKQLLGQIDQHFRLAKRGLWVDGNEYPGEKITIGYGKNPKMLRIAVLPSDWKLPRSFRFVDTKSGKFLEMEQSKPQREDDEIAQIGNNEWLVTLRWSKEAIAEAAYAMTFWYMEKVGEVIYSNNMPKAWKKMTPAEAGRNAAKMMLYYAILRCRTLREEKRAISLYNTYGFGYALGMNYKNKNGRHEMLWPEDLHEILATGKTKDGGTIQ